MRRVSRNGANSRVAAEIARCAPNDGGGYRAKEEGSERKWGRDREALSKPRVISLVMTSTVPTSPVRRERSADLKPRAAAAAVAVRRQIPRYGTSAPGPSLTPKGIVLRFSGRRIVRNFRRNTRGSDENIYYVELDISRSSQSRTRAYKSSHFSRRVVENAPFMLLRPFSGFEFVKMLLFA